MTVNAAQGGAAFSVQRFTKSRYAYTDAFSLEKESTLWLKTFTTGMPRTYSTMVPFMVSRESW